MNIGLTPLRANNSGMQINPEFADEFQDINPQLLLLLQQLLQMTGGEGGGGALPQGCFGGGGGGFGGGGNPGSGSSGIGDFLGGGSGGYSGHPGNGNYSGGHPGIDGVSSNQSSGGWVSGGDSYVPGGLDSADRGGAIAGNSQGERAISWAESQLGVSESNNPGAVRGYSRGAWQAWCADFVSTALNKSGGSKMGHQSSVAGILDWGKKNDRFTSAAEAKRNPASLQTGDIATWKSEGRSHVGLVTGIDPKTGSFTTIEGNTSDKVARRTHSFNSRGLTGFVRATDSKKQAAGTSAATGSSSSRSSGSTSTKSSGSSTSSSSSSSSSSGKK